MFTTIRPEFVFPDASIAELRRRGHNVVVGQGVFGSGNVIKVGDDGAAIDVGAEVRTNHAAGVIVTS